MVVEKWAFDRQLEIDCERRKKAVTDTLSREWKPVSAAG